jgi:hypothetical protein
MKMTAGDLFAIMQANKMVEESGQGIEFRSFARRVDGIALQEEKKKRN